MGKVIYLTGAPASGKSSICNLLERRVPNTMIFRFGSELTALVKGRGEVTQEGLRSSSAHLVTPKDVAAVENMMVDFARKNRVLGHVVIDTHALTREPYGFRLTPVPHKRIIELDADAFVTMITRHTRQSVVFKRTLKVGQY